MTTASFKEKIKGIGGNASYEAKARVLREQLDAKIPAALKLPPAILEDPPLDITHIPETCGLLNAQELTITELDATAVCQKIAAGELTAVEVVTAFGKRAAIAHQLTACLMDFFMDEGIRQAQQLDEYFQKEGKVIGPLHGLPISVKGHFPLKGTVGCGGFLVNMETSTEDCDMTSILRSLGAVFYVKTNQPQSLMHLESKSSYGRVVFEPHNTNLTPGGSSGGESALVAMKGSCMGLGTDGGGSIRGPCAHCGIYGIRPSSRTTPAHGLLWYQPGQDGIFPATGPMCRSARDMRLFLEAVLGANPALRDPEILPIPLKVPDLTQKKLRVGIMMHDGVVMPHPPTIRALNLVKEKLEASSEVEVVDYIPYDHDRGFSIIRELYYEDGGATVRRILEESGEDMHPLTEWVISPPVKNHDAAQVWKLRDQRDTYRREYSDYWRSQNVDVVVCPPFQGTASRHDTTKYIGYTAIWNLLDYPGAVFPTGLVADPAIDIYQESPTPMSAVDEYNISLYDAAIFKGAPVSLQTVSRRFNDGLVLAAQDVIERILKS
ncbi:amidase signature domain-containing protein [Suillus spraguei]|nr:amidase signature domain-containing protein [Suillus spraguei]